MRNPDKQLIGRVRRRIICANCGAELDNLNHCPSCGARAIFTIKVLCHFVFERDDGTSWGSIIEQAKVDTRILNANSQLLALIRETKGWHQVDLIGHAYSLLDQTGKVLAHYQGDRLGKDYLLVTPSNKVVARVQAGSSDLEFSVYASSGDFDSFLVLSYAVFIDMAKRALAEKRKRTASKSSFRPAAISPTKDL